MNVTDATATVGIVDDRISMMAEGEVNVYLNTPDCQPLSRDETHATLRVSGDDYRAKVELDAAQLDALVDELTAAQQGETDE